MLSSWKVGHISHNYVFSTSCQAICCRCHILAAYDVEGMAVNLSQAHCVVTVAHKSVAVAVKPPAPAGRTTTVVVAHEVS